jgi:UrcA family protein
MNRPSLPGSTSIFLVFALTMFATIALVASPVTHARQVPLQRVQVGDIDLATPNGQRHLARRIDAAINAVCVQPNRSLPRSRAVVEAIDACRTAALLSARHQLADLGIRPGVQAAHTR